MYAFLVFYLQKITIVIWIHMVKCTFEDDYKYNDLIRVVVVKDTAEVVDFVHFFLYDGLL